jgi:hypothetical protein
VGEVSIIGRSRDFEYLAEDIAPKRRYRP